MSFFDEADAMYDDFLLILNVKYVNSSALKRVAQEFERNGVNISKQTMSNWIVKCADKYFAPFVERMKQELLKPFFTAEINKENRCFCKLQ